jgi:hypothetical protein
VGTVDELVDGDVVDQLRRTFEAMLGPCVPS